MIFKKIFIFLLAVIVLFTVACSPKDNEQVGEEVLNTDMYILNNIEEGELILTVPGTYHANETGIFEGNLIIKSTGITIKDTEINGDITLHEDLGEGDAYLENVRVNGSTYVYGGGINSMHCKIVYIPHLYIKKLAGKVRIVAEEDTKIDEVVATTSSIIEMEDDSSSIDNLKVDPDDPESEINIKGNIQDVEVMSKCNINIEEEGNIENINITESASGVNIYGDGNIDTVVVNANDVNISTEVNDIYSTNNIEEVIVDGDKVSLSSNTSDSNHNDDEDISKENDQSSTTNDNEDVTDNDSNEDVNVDKENNDDDQSEEEKNNDNVEYSFIKSSSVFSNSNQSFTLTVMLSKPGKVYYVYEDISVMFGGSYSPSNAQVINGYNCFGQPNPKPFVEIEDEDGNMSEQEFPPEVIIAGSINVTEANKEFTVFNDEPTLKFDNDQTIELTSKVNLHIVAVDEEGNEIRISPTIINE